MAQHAQVYELTVVVGRGSRAAYNQEWIGIARVGARTADAARRLAIQAVKNEIIAASARGAFVKVHCLKNTGTFANGERVISIEESSSSELGGDMAQSKLRDCGPDCGCAGCKGRQGGMLVGLLSGCGCPNPKVEQVQGLGADYHTSGFYVSTYCNFAHDTKTGRPIDHECIIIPPKALRAEMDGDISGAIEILNVARQARKLRVVKGRKMKSTPIDGFSPEGRSLLLAGAIGIGLYMMAKA